MPDKGHDHALSFVRSVSGGPDAGPSTRFIEVVDGFTAALDQSDEAVTAVKKALEWAGKPLPSNLKDEYKRVRKGVADPELDGGVDEGVGLALVSGYMRAMQSLEDQNVRDRVHERLQSPSDLAADIEAGLAGLEENLVGHLVIEAESERQSDKSFQARMDKASKEVKAMRHQVKELATRGKGREGSWEVGVTVICATTLWWCVVVGVIFFVVIIGSIVTGK